MWKYDVSEGKLYDRNGVYVGKGYAGNGKGLNNPAADDQRAIGPTPRGLWSIGAPYDAKSTGPYTLALTPAKGTETHGRTLFRIHGDNRAMNFTASHGCIILSRKVRELIGRSGDRDLMVVG